MAFYSHDADLLNELTATATKQFGGHVTIMKFTTNWRVGFGTPTFRCNIDRMYPGKIFREAAKSALAAYARGEHESPESPTHEFFRQEGIEKCPDCGETLPLTAA